MSRRQSFAAQAQIETETQRASNIGRRQSTYGEHLSLAAAVGEQTDKVTAPFISKFAPTEMKANHLLLMMDPPVNNMSRRGKAHLLQIRSPYKRIALILSLTVLSLVWVATTLYLLVSSATIGGANNGIIIFNNTKYVSESESIKVTNLIAEPLNPSLHRVGLEIHNAAVVELQNKEKLRTTGFAPGQFCFFCQWTKESMCAGRLRFLMTRYKINETAAKASLRDRCTTPIIPRNVNKEEDEPSIILQVGPHKTGTTALQSFIYDMAKLRNNTLLEDNLRVPLQHELPGFFKSEGVGLNLPHCSINRHKRDGGQMSEAMCGIMRETFPKFVVDAYNKSQNILLVAEDFDRPEINFNRLHFFLQPYKKIKVISTYRRLHDWLPSWYNQIVDHYKVEYAKGSETYPSFLEWLEEKYDRFLLSHGIALAERFTRYEFIESVHLINMHNMGDSLVETFFCDILRAKATCNAIKTGGARPSKSNIGTDHEYQRLAIAAKRAGLIPASSLEKKIHIRRVSQFLKMQVEQTNTSLPRLCPSNKTLQKIFTLELEHERRYFPSWFESQGGEEGLRRSFDRAVQMKFCVFDVVQILDSGIMDDIFKEVNK